MNKQSEVIAILEERLLNIHRPRRRFARDLWVRSEACKLYSLIAPLFERESTKMWAVYKDKSLQMAGGTEHQAWAWFAQVSFDTDIEDDGAIEKSIRTSKKHGYTCSPIHVIKP